MHAHDQRTNVALVPLQGQGLPGVMQSRELPKPELMPHSHVLERHTNQAFLALLPALLLGHLILKLLVGLVLQMVAPQGTPRIRPFWDQARQS